MYLVRTTYVPYVTEIKLYFKESMSGWDVAKKQYHGVVAIVMISLANDFYVLPDKKEFLNQNYGEIKILLAFSFWFSTGCFNGIAKTENLTKKVFDPPGEKSVLSFKLVPNKCYYTNIVSKTNLSPIIVCQIHNFLSCAWAFPVLTRERKYGVSSTETLHATPTFLAVHRRIYCWYRIARISKSFF